MQFNTYRKQLLLSDIVCMPMQISFDTIHMMPILCVLVSDTEIQCQRTLPTMNSVSHTHNMIAFKHVKEKAQ